MMKKSLKIKLAENISHTKKYGSEGGLLTPPPPKKSEGVGGGPGKIRSNHGNIQASPSSSTFSSSCSSFSLLVFFLFTLVFHVIIFRMEPDPNLT